MNPKKTVKLNRKKAEREISEVQNETGFFVDPNMWSTAVRSWVREFQQDRRGQSIPAFDSVFNDALPEPGSALPSLSSRVMENLDG